MGTEPQTELNKGPGSVRAAPPLLACACHGDAGPRLPAASQWWVRVRVRVGDGRSGPGQPPGACGGQWGMQGSPAQAATLGLPWPRPRGGPTQALQGLPGAWLCRRGILLPACSWSPWHFGVHTSRLRLGGLRPPRCHSFLPANCLALSPASPSLAPSVMPYFILLPMANCAWTKHSPLSGCQAVFGKRTQAWLWAVGTAWPEAPWTAARNSSDTLCSSDQVPKPVLSTAAPQQQEPDGDENKARAGVPVLSW